MSEIIFGEVENTAPQPALRPDRNAQFATVAYGRPRDGDLPVFIDVDVLCDLEVHALSNTNVELGGVLLGGQFVDEEGRPFVTITEAIRAEHYEATKGSFKFTHDTWSSISRRRDEFSPDLAMVGWYHTHPSWGVFLSGMDQFICEHFFPRPHDVALVIDPCRGDRGLFQWSGRANDPLSRTGGFFVMASRFREGELQNFVAQLEGSTMPLNSGSGAPGSAPVVHIVEPRGGGAQQIAVIGMLTIQFCFLALLAWRMLAPPSTLVEAGAVAAQQRETEVKAERAALDRVFTHLNEGTDGLAGEVKKRDAENEKLRAAVIGYGALEDEKTRLDKLLKKADDSREQMRTEISRLEEQQSKAKATTKSLEAQIADLQKKLGVEGDEADAEARGAAYAWSVPTVLAAVAGVMLLAGGAALIVARRRGGGDAGPRDDLDSVMRSPPGRATVGVRDGA